MFFHVQEIWADARYDPTARTYLFTNSTLVVTRYGRPIPYTNDGRDCVVFNADLANGLGHAAASADRCG